MLPLMDMLRMSGNYRAAELFESAWFSMLGVHTSTTPSPPFDVRYLKDNIKDLELNCTTGPDDDTLAMAARIADCMDVVYYLVTPILSWTNQPQTELRVSDHFLRRLPIYMQNPTGQPGGRHIQN